MSGKGQMTILALIMIVFTLVVFAVLTPTLTSFINATVVNGGLDSNAAALMQMIPFFLILAIVLSVFFMAIPQRPQGG